MKISRVQILILLWISVSLSASDAFSEKPQDEAPQIKVTTVQSKAVTLTQQYVCQLHSQRHIEVRAPAEGYLAAIPIKEGQTVKREDLLFQVRPLMDKEKLDTENENKMVAIKSPFGGMIDRLKRQQGSFVQKGETLTTLSDNSVMWVYFNVSEKRYLEYVAELGQSRQSPDIEVMLADGNKFSQPGKIGAIGAEFNAGNVAFRADFPNPNNLLRHGQTGTVLISEVQNDAIVIPQRATLEALNKRYVYVVDKDDVAHQREILIQNESEDLFVVIKGVVVGDKIVLEGGQTRSRRCQGRIRRSLTGGGHGHARRNQLRIGDHDGDIRPLGQNHVIGHDATAALDLALETMTNQSCSARGLRWR